MPIPMLYSIIDEPLKLFSFYSQTDFQEISQLSFILFNWLLCPKNNSYKCHFLLWWSPNIGEGLEVKYLNFKDIVISYRLQTCISVYGRHVVPGSVLNIIGTRGSRWGYSYRVYWRLVFWILSDKDTSLQVTTPPILM